jgi:VCPO second helical-bundle domain
LNTPPYPDHPSGATAYASASMHAFASFFGSDEMGMPFFLTSSRFPTDPAQPREQRSFTKFSDVTNEILEARIWAGIHFRSPDAQSEKLGGEVEHYIHTHLFASQ